MIEGVAEATALITKVFSGYLSDYFASASCSAVLGLRPGRVVENRSFRSRHRLAWIVFARFIDRVGKVSAGRRAMP